VSFAVWWGAAFGLVMLAFIMAALDLMDLRRQLSEEKKKLLRTYLLDKKFLGDLEEKIGERQKQQGQQEARSAEGKSEGSGTAA
jgi:hypothetical protein